MRHPTGITAEWNKDTPEVQFYFAVVHQTGPRSYGIHLPDIDGCSTTADHEREIVPAATRALIDVALRHPLPKPAGLPEIERRARLDLAAGASIVPVPVRAIWP